MKIFLTMIAILLLSACSFESRTTTDVESNQTLNNITPPEVEEEESEEEAEEEEEE